MPQSGVHHDLLVGRTNNENSHPQYVSKRFFDSILATFWPATIAGAFPNTGVDVSAAIQNAFDTAPDGATIFFRAGTYKIFTMTNVTRSNLTIWLEPGALFQGDPASNIVSVINIQGVHDALSTNLGTTVASGDQDAINITATGAWNVGDWIMLRDDKQRSTVPPVAGQHLEVNRVKFINDATHLTLYYPTTDTYTTGLTGRIDKITPVENVCITGGGRITNFGVDNTQGGDAIRMEWAVNCSVDNIEMYDVRSQCVGMKDCFQTVVENCYLHDAPAFDGSKGYGVTCTSCLGNIWVNNTTSRLRHAFDVSFFSCDSVIANNTTHASGFINIVTHPDVRHCVISNNTIDGGRGFEAGTPAVEMGDGGGGGTSGATIGVGEDNHHIIVSNNTILNAALYGIGCNKKDCSDILIVNNTVKHANFRAVNSAAGIVCASPDGISCPNLSITGNIVEDCPDAGIIVGYSKAAVFANSVRGITGAASKGIWLATDFTGASIAGTVISCNSVAQGAYGIYLGSNDFGGSGSIAHNLISGNLIYDMTLSGIFVQQESDTKSYANHITNNIVLDCNGSVNDNHGAIVMVEENTVGQAFMGNEGGEISGNYIKGDSKYGIVIGLSNSIVSRNRIANVDNGAGVGIGIWIRAKNNGGGADPVTNVRVTDNEVYGCTSDGIRIGSPSGAGMVESCLIKNNTCTANLSGITGQELSDSCRLVGNRCYDSAGGTGYGIAIIGDNYRVFDNDCSALTTTAQDFGIYIDADADGTILRNNWCEGNGNDEADQISINGTNTEFHDSAMREVSIADANHTIGAHADEKMYNSIRYSSLTAARVVTLRAANAVGFEFRVHDGSGNCSGANTLTLTCVGADVFDDGGGAATYVLNTAYAAAHVRCVAQGRWKVI